MEDIVTGFFCSLISGLLVWWGMDSRMNRRINTYRSTAADFKAQLLAKMEELDRVTKDRDILEAALNNAIVDLKKLKTAILCLNRVAKEGEDGNS